MRKMINQTLTAVQTDFSLGLVGDRRYVRIRGVIALIGGFSIAVPLGEVLSARLFLTSNPAAGGASIHVRAEDQQVAVHLPNGAANVATFPMFELKRTGDDVMRMDQVKFRAVTTNSGIGQTFTIQVDYEEVALNDTEEAIYASLYG